MSLHRAEGLPLTHLTGDRGVVYVVLPWGERFGWGLCGKYVSKELSRLTGVKCVIPDFGPQLFGNELEYRYFRERVATRDELAAIATHDSCAVLQAVLNDGLRPLDGPIAGLPKVGYVFYENTPLSAADLSNADAYYDVIACGSSWCESVLRGKGLTRLATVVQGIDPVYFHSGCAEKELFRDRFVVFSGGKFELRKGQDIVLRAYKVLQDRYPDVMLVNSWYNPWKFSVSTMHASPHIRFRQRSEDHFETVGDLLADNGIDAARVITLPGYPNSTMPAVYRNCDVGLFPNRCEAGTNLVLMEFMACGKPVIASYNTGHQDIVNRENALLIEGMKAMEVFNNGQRFATWADPDLDETIDRLDWAYHHREGLRVIGTRGADCLAGYTWQRTARRLLSLLGEVAEADRPANLDSRYETADR